MTGAWGVSLCGFGAGVIGSVGAAVILGMSDVVVLPPFTVTGYSHLAVVPWLVKRCCRARWALRSRIRAW